MKRRQADNLARVSRADEFVQTSATAPRAVIPTGTHVTSGTILWTLTQRNATAQARRWITPTGYELEMHIWTGARVEGQEDLSWSQLFTTEQALADTADAKKRQLEAAGWIEDLEATAL